MKRQRQAAVVFNSADNVLGYLAIILLAGAQQTGCPYWGLS